MNDRKQIKNQRSEIANGTKIVRVIARLNVGGPAKHVVWLSKACRGRSLIPSWSPALSLQAKMTWVISQPRWVSARLCSRDEPRDFFKRRSHRLETLSPFPSRTTGHRSHTHRKSRNRWKVGRFTLSLAYSGNIIRPPASVSLCSHLSRTYFSQLLWTTKDARVSDDRKDPGRAGYRSHCCC